MCLVDHELLPGLQNADMLPVWLTYRQFHPPAYHDHQGPKVAQQYAKVSKIDSPLSASIISMTILLVLFAPHTVIKESQVTTVEISVI